MFRNQHDKPNTKMGCRSFMDSFGLYGSPLMYIVQCTAYNEHYCIYHCPLHTTAPVQCTIYTSVDVHCRLHNTVPVHCQLRTTVTVHCTIFTTAPLLFIILCLGGRRGPGPGGKQGHHGGGGGGVLVPCSCTCHFHCIGP